jgi:hypothetical protein
MAFWNDAQLEPKRSYRFLLLITGFQPYLIKSVKKPSFTIGETPHQYLNHTFYYPGRVTWNEIDFTIVDTVGDSDNGTRQIMGLLERSGYQLPTAQGYDTISKARATEAMGQIEIQTIDADGNVKEKWFIKNAWIKSATFGDLSYENETMLNIGVTLRYDNAGVQFMEGQPGKLPSKLSV